MDGKETLQGLNPTQRPTYKQLMNVETGINSLLQGKHTYWLFDTKCSGQNHIDKKLYADCASHI